MASIQQSGRGFRAVIRKVDHYTTRSFRTREEAETWAAQEEDAYYRRKNGDVNPVGYAQAIKQLPGLPTREDILAGAGDFCRSGVYFLLLGNEVVYVGQSSNLISRLAEHVVSADWGRPFDRYAILPCSEGLRMPLERHYIAELQPRYNVNGFGRGNRPDLQS